MKIYMTDMLQLMRRADADAVSATILAAITEDEVKRATEAALRFVAEVSSARYARKLVERLREIVPEDWLADLDATAADLPANAAETA
ncbi:MAG: hypothetical protein H2060_11130 [Azoarcus sp.]|nr:hypothetical protein [Azoarcus sp.]